MSSTADRGGETIVTADYDEVHFNGDEVSAMGKHNNTPGNSDRESRFFGMDVAGAFSRYDAAQRDFSTRYPGVRPEAFTDGGAALDRRNLLRIDLQLVQREMDALIDAIVEGIVDGRDVAAAMSVVENTVRFPGTGAIDNDQTFKHVMRSLIDRLEAEVGARGGDLGGLRASHEAVEIRTDLGGKIMAAVARFLRRLSPEQELDAMKSWIGVLAEGVADLRLRHAIAAAEAQPETVPNFGVREMAIEAAEVA